MRPPVSDIDSVVGDAGHDEASGLRRPPPQPTDLTPSQSFRSRSRSARKGGRVQAEADPLGRSAHLTVFTIHTSTLLMLTTFNGWSRQRTVTLPADGALRCRLTGAPS